MTSSLVGSEMCIRDRFSTLPVAGRQDEGRDESLNHATDVRKPIGPCAVSYTHLTLPTICSV
eukprot:8964358-Prorocentrum_lima.AAC.1